MYNNMWFPNTRFFDVINKEKLIKLEEEVIGSLSDDDFKKYFLERKERHGVKNVVTCDAPIVILIVKNERANEDWIKIDAGIASMSIIVAAQNFGIESMCLGIVANEKCEELFGLKKGSLVLGVAIGKPKGKIELKPKVIKSKVSYVE